jgi:hypothetical protein
MSVKKSTAATPEKEQKMKELTRRVTNQKARIFDVIENRTNEMNEMEKHKLKADEMGKEVLRQQKVLEGERKVLAQKEEEYNKLYPEVTVNKAS